MKRILTFVLVLAMLAVVLPRLLRRLTLWQLASCGCLLLLPGLLLVLCRRLLLLPGLLCGLCRRCLRWCGLLCRRIRPGPWRWRSVEVYVFAFLMVECVAVVNEAVVEAVGERLHTTFRGEIFLLVGSADKSQFREYGRHRRAA